MVANMYVPLVFLSMFAALSVITVVFGFLAFFLYNKYRVTEPLDEPLDEPNVVEGEYTQSAYPGSERRAGGDTLITDD